MGNYKCLILKNNPGTVAFFHDERCKMSKVKIKKQPESDLKWQGVSQPQMKGTGAAK